MSVTSITRLQHSSAPEMAAPDPTNPAAARRPDGRNAPRKALRSTAFLRFDGHRPQQSCLVQDISATGAKLQFEQPAVRPFGPSTRFPEEFKLVLPNDRIEIDCKLAWQTAKCIGVVFVSNFRPLRILGKR